MNRPMLNALIVPVMVIFIVTASAGSAFSKTDNLGDPAELEAFLDGFFASAMEQYHVPGLVFVIVKDGEIFLAKGYGFADLDTERKVDPRTTGFLVASVSKLITATAVMQLVDQGKLDLHRDVNTYLSDFQLPSVFPNPVTAHHLLTHTAGFDEQFFGGAARQPEELRPLGVYLAERMPRRALPPGDVFSYSNYGMALAGFLVESITGLPFETYVEENIFAPLGMTKSSFLLSPELASDLAQGYFYYEHTYHSAPYDYFMNAPSASLVTTGTDMARFMIAHLQNGRLGDVRILSDEMARLMHARQFTHHPKLQGHAYGFYEDIINGRRLIGHSGNWRGFASHLALDPDAELGLFVSFNSLSFAATENGLHFDLAKAFYDRYFPATPEPVSQPSSGFTPQGQRFSGAYRNTRYMRDCFGKLGALPSEWRVTANADGTITAHPPGGLEASMELTQVEPLLFLRKDGGGYVAFREDPAGRITYMFLHPWGPEAFHKLPTLESSQFQLPLFAVIILIFLSALLGWPLAYLLRQPRPKQASGARIARWLAASMVSLFLCSFILIVIELSGDLFDYAYGVPTRMAILLRVQYLTAVLALGMVGLTIFAWRRGWWTFMARVHYSVLTLAAVMLIPFLIYWRLLGFGW